MNPVQYSVGFVLTFSLGYLTRDYRTQMIDYVEELLEIKKTPTPTPSPSPEPELVELVELVKPTKTWFF